MEELEVLIVVSMSSRFLLTVVGIAAKHDAKKKRLSKKLCVQTNRRIEL